MKSLKMYVLNRIVAIIAVSLIWSLSACVPLKMATPQSLLDVSDAYPVDRPGYTTTIGEQTWKIGPFTAKKANVGGTKSFYAGIGGFSVSKVSQEFSFVAVDENGTECSAECVIGEFKMMFHIGDSNLGRNSLPLACRYVLQDQTSNLEATIPSSTGEDKTAGVLKSGEEETTITMTRKQQASDWPTSQPTGYIFTVNGKPVGAVDVANKGMVYIGKDLSNQNRLLLAAASVSMMLYDSNVDH